MYSVRQILKQEPAGVSAAALNILGVLVIVGAVSVSSEVTAAIGMAITNVLALFYVRKTTVSKDALSELAG